MVAAATKILARLAQTPTVKGGLIRASSNALNELRKVAFTFVGGNFYKCSEGMQLAKLAGGAFTGLWSPLQAIRCYQEGSRALHNTGNIEGSIAYSWGQCASYATTGLTAARAMLTRSGLAKALMTKAPIFALLPAAIGYSGDIFFSLTKADNPLMKLTQFGMSNNILRTSKIRDGEFMDSRLHEWWLANVRPLDEKIAKAIGFDLDRGDLNLGIAQRTSLAVT